jgi:hypothetical protein
MKQRVSKLTAQRSAIASMLVALATVGVAARAEPPQNAEREKLGGLLRAGAGAARKKDFAACIDAYSSALGLEETPVTLGELGLCEEAAGRNADAHRHLAAALRAPRVDPTNQRWQAFGDAFARAGARIAQVYIAVDPPQAGVIVDGRPVGKADGRRVALEPGPHTIAARLDGYEDKSETRALEAGSSPSFHLVLVPKPPAAPASTARPEASAKPAPPAPAPPAPAPSAPVPERRPEAAPAWYMPAWSVRGVLVTATYASLTTLLASGATAIGLQVDLTSVSKGLDDTSCAPAQPSPPPECAVLRDRRFQRDVALSVLAGAFVTSALFGVATGLAIQSEKSHFRPSIAPTVSMQGGGITVFGAW